MSIIDQARSFGSSGTVALSVEREAVQAKVAERFPMGYEKVFGSATLRDPVVILAADDRRLGLDITIDLKVPLLGSKSGRLVVMGHLRFDEAERAVFVDKPEITSVDVPGLSTKMTEQLSKVAATVIEERLKAVPIYRIPEKQAGAVRDVYVDGGKLMVIVSLQNLIPVRWMASGGLLALAAVVAIAWLIWGR